MMMIRPYYWRGLELASRAVGAARFHRHGDTDGLRYVATVAVWMHWLVVAFCLLQLVYRPAGWPEKYVAYGPLFVLLVLYNAMVHYRLAANRTITWNWILGLVTVDIAMVSILIVIGGGFDHYFFHLLYYPALAGYAVVFTSFRLTMLGVTIVALVYLGISLTVGDGLEIETKDEKPLFARIFVMYAVTASVNLVSRFERMRWGRAVERERALQRERIEFSQSVHDTAAQSAYIMSLGIDAARSLAGDANPQLAETLEATSQISRSTIWELRHPISVGGIYEGQELNAALRDHVKSFTNVTGVEAEFSLAGTELSLPVSTKSHLFSVAHNALTNAFRHAQASRVEVRLAFAEHRISLSILDDGIGLPAGYQERGHGFPNMERDAERIGGSLEVVPEGALGGASITCHVPGEDS